MSDQLYQGTDMAELDGSKSVTYVIAKSSIEEFEIVP